MDDDVLKRQSSGVVNPSTTDNYSNTAGYGEVLNYYRAAEFGMFTTGVNGGAPTIVVLSLLSG